MMPPKGQKLYEDIPMAVRSWRLPVDLVDWVKSEAAKEHRSVNNFLWKLLARERLLRQRDPLTQQRERLLQELDPLLARERQQGQTMEEMGV